MDSFQAPFPVGSSLATDWESFSFFLGQVSYVFLCHLISPIFPRHRITPHQLNIIFLPLQTSTPHAQVDVAETLHA